MLILGIFFSVVLPVFLLIGTGILSDRFLKIDLQTLTKLNFYVFVPALVFVKVYEAALPGGEMARVAGFSLLHLAILFVASQILFSIGPARKHRPLYTASAVFYNAGNYGIPFAGLAFGDQAIGVMAVLIMVQNFLGFTVGLWLFKGHSGGVIRSVVSLLKVPAILAILSGLALRYVHDTAGIEIPKALMVPLGHLANGLIPVALITLGVQLSRTRVADGISRMGVVVLARLIASPLLAAGLVWVFGIEGPLAPVLIATAGLPVAVNVFILASEYGEDAESASQAVFWSTLLSGITLSTILWILG